MRQFINIINESAGSGFAEQAARLIVFDAKNSEIIRACVLHELGFNADQIEQGDAPSREKLDEMITDWAFSKCAATEANILKKFENGKLTIYREITAQKNWKPDSRHPGVCWTWDINCAYAYEGDLNGQQGHVLWLLTAEITIDKVDWIETIRLNVSPGGYDENEVRLKHGVSIDYTYQHYERAVGNVRG